MESIVTDRMWKLLELALENLKKVEKDERYVVNMSHWHTVRHNKCYVCLAGARLAGAGCPIDTSINVEYDLNSDVLRMLETLDCLRVGRVYSAQERFYDWFDESDLKNDLNVPYHIDRDLWWEEMTRILQELKDLDL